MLPRSAWHFLALYFDLPLFSSMRDLLSCLLTSGHIIPYSVFKMKSTPSGEWQSRHHAIYGGRAASANMAGAIVDLQITVAMQID